MRSDNKPTKPSIIICTAVLQGYEYKLRELRAGMEEEGIPYSLQRVEAVMQYPLPTRELIHLSLV
ncbi:hypothetical protein N752_16655 [Desulforamulus aquiferis]|nr:hypothetical protein [Desulforamulus aquiferis]RYD04020.1 hypothetical protein N752_16655 [Desulforamulus aquiferis]